MLSAYEIIAKKRDDHELDAQEIKWFIDGLVAGKIEKHQMSALLMAIYLNGFSTSETAALTDAMLYSGKTVSFDGQHVVDKHSTGGIGDKASFILAPLATACGIQVPMIAGRGLGHTGGTIDKVEAIEGFKTSLSLEDFKKQVQGLGIALIGQTKDIAPADKMIYALRDITATIESIPLITASIMSKKLAEGAAGIVMDIKVGNGAFMANKSKARALATSIRKTGLRFNKNMVTVLTDMNQPLGFAVGNTLEIIESIETLKGRGPKDLTDLSLHLAGAMIYAGGKAKTLKAGVAQAKKALNSGAALKVFKDMIKEQGGLDKVVDDYSLLPQAKNQYEVCALKTAYLKKMDAKAFGRYVVELGGGRARLEDKIDFGVGLIFHKKIGDKVKEGEVILTIHHNDDQKDLVKKIAQQVITKDLSFSKTALKNKPELIIETQTAWSH
jgi:pyrimidine-nucleoside phosphorylase